MSVDRGWHLLTSAELPAEVSVAQLSDVTGLSRAQVQVQLNRWGVAAVPDRYGPHGARFYPLALVLPRAAVARRGRPRRESPELLDKG